ncbi:MAG: YbgC/FadM family acyl-CoA thioesterase [Nitrospiraceae bacterium]|nr:YbgC/FadM family acyl-CoA thioesterase [Nitrospiraceae bacterium]
MKHIHRVKIYYEDTDCGGVVYYANYLRYFERARTELFGAEGFSLKKLAEEGTQFVVAEAFLKYLAPGRYGDVLLVETWAEKIGSVSIVFGHLVVREETGERLAEGRVKLGAVGKDMRPTRLGRDIIQSLVRYGDGAAKGGVR